MEVAKPCEYGGCLGFLNHRGVCGKCKRVPSQLAKGLDDVLPPPNVPMHSGCHVPHVADYADRIAPKPKSFADRFQAFTEGDE